VQEEWRKVEEYPSYEVSNMGGVKRVVGSKYQPNVPRRLNPTPNSTGYPTVTFVNGGAKKTIYVHRLVAVTFLGPPPEGHEVAHNNGDRTDARLANLRWATPKENHGDKVRHGTLLRGEGIVGAVLTESDVLSMRREYSTGGISIKSIAESRGFASSTVRYAVAGLTWGHLSPSESIS